MSAAGAAGVADFKRAIIVGASSGIGRELAIVLSHAGWSVGLMARRREELDETGAEDDFAGDRHGGRYRGRRVGRRPGLPSWCAARRRRARGPLVRSRLSQSRAELVRGAGDDCGERDVAARLWRGCLSGVRTGGARTPRGDLVDRRPPRRIGRAGLRGFEGVPVELPGGTALPGDQEGTADRGDRHPARLRRHRDGEGRRKILVASPQVAARQIYGCAILRRAAVTPM